MKFRATNEQMKSLMAAVVNASAPAGLGILHFQSRDYSPDMFSVNDEMRNVSIDYFGGRMVKFAASRVAGDSGLWSCRNRANDEYQSWARTYPSYIDLVDAVIGSDAIIEVSE